MDFESINVNLLERGKNILNSVLRIHEEDPKDCDNVFLELHCRRKIIGKSAGDYFSAMQAIRRVLELDGIQMLCNGAAKNVYPSPMQRTGSNAYILEQGCPATLSNVVSIFDKSDGLDFVNVDEQELYYSNWIKSL